MQDYRRAMHNQGVPLLPSGQHPPVFEAMLSNLKSISKWSVDTFVPSILHMHTTQGPKAGGAPKRKANQEEDEPEEETPAKKKKYIAASRQVPLIDRCMKSLREYKLSLYRPYEPEELKIFWPSREWDIPVWKGNGFDWGRVRHITLMDAPDDLPVIRRRVPVPNHPPLPQSEENEEEDEGKDEDETETESEESEQEESGEEEEGEGEDEEEAKDEKELIMARHEANKRAERKERERELAAREIARIEHERSIVKARQAMDAKARDVQEAKEKARRSRERKRAAFLRHVQEGEEEEEPIRTARNDLSMLGEARRRGGMLLPLSHFCHKFC